MPWPELRTKLLHPCNIKNHNSKSIRRRMKLQTAEKKTWNCSLVWNKTYNNHLHPNHLFIYRYIWVCFLLLLRFATKIDNNNSKLMKFEKHLCSFLWDWLFTIFQCVLLFPLYTSHLGVERPIKEINVGTKQGKVSYPHLFCP